jgi:hypothetical protein
MLCECMLEAKSCSAADFLALIRRVDRIELEIPAVIVYLIECNECRSTHSLEVPLQNRPSADLTPAAALFAWLTDEQFAPRYKRAA